MVEVSNNLLAGLLLVAIVISGSGFLIIAGMGPVVITGRATELYGTANVTIGTYAAIKMLRNVTDFGSSALGGADVTIHTQQQNLGTGYAFNNGSEGNGTNYGTGTYAYPFVVKNIGNRNVSINLSADKEAGDADPWIHAAAAALFKGKNNNTLGGCDADWQGAFAEGSWTNLNESQTIVCTDLYPNESRDEIRMHFRLQIPSAAAGPKGTVITIGAVDSES